MNSYPYIFTCINILLTQTHSSVKVVMYMPTLLRVIFLSNVFLLDSFFFVFLTLYLFISYRQIGNCIGIDYSSLHIYVYICICYFSIPDIYEKKCPSHGFIYEYIVDCQQISSLSSCCLLTCDAFSFRFLFRHCIIRCLYFSFPLSVVLFYDLPIRYIDARRSICWQSIGQQKKE